MTEDPFRPPNSDVDDKAKKTPHPSAAWRVFFGFNCLLITLNILFIPLVEAVGFFEIIDFTFTNLAFVGLYGFIFLKPIGKVVFWRYFFYAAIVENFLVLVVFPLFKIPIYGQQLPFDWWYLVSVVNTFFTLVALNIYAYKIRSIW